MYVLRSTTQLGNQPKNVEATKVVATLPPPKQVETVEQSALRLITVTDNDFAALATQRAEAVKAWLLISNRVDAARVFLGAGDGGELKTDGSRVYLQLE